MKSITIDDIREACDKVAKLARKCEWKARLHGIPPYNQQILINGPDSIPLELVRKSELAGIPIRQSMLVPEGEIWLIGTEQPRQSLLGGPALDLRMVKINGQTCIDIRVSMARSLCSRSRISEMR
jgi:hypothetical protein